MARPEVPPSRTPVIGIAGWKKSGKTTLTVRLVEEFSRRGYRVATVKHAHHAFQIDEGEADSARHRRAGAAEVVIVSGARWAIVHELVDGEPEPDLADVLAWLAPADIVVVEGYKSAAILKIEARRREARQSTPLVDTDPMVVAIAADHPVADARVPAFDLDDVAGIADFIALTVGARPSRAGAASASVRSSSKQ